MDATGTYFAQLRVVCTSGLDVGVSDLRLLYADEVDSNGKVLSALWSTPLRAANPVEFSIGGRTYRSVVLDASALSEERTPAVYGITDLTGAGIPTDERTIEMYVNSRRYPASCILTWVSDGEQMAIVIEDNPPLVVSKTAEAEQIASEAVASTFLWAEDDPFESLGANTYDGFLCDEDGALQGTVSVKTAKKTVHKGVESVKVTATVVDLAGKKWSYKNGQVSSEGLVSGLLCTKKTSPGEFGGLLLGRNGMMGTWGGFKIVGSRNGMGKKGDVMQSMMQFYKGKRAIDVLLELNDGTGLNCRLTQLKIGAKGRWGAENSRSTTSYSSPFSIRGDLQMYEFQLALKPYYELTEWFMIRGTLGVGLDYRNFDVKVSGLGSETSDDWDCYMVYGLGGMLYWKGMCLGADFLGKVFDDDLDVDTKYVNGSIGNAKWGFRAYVGYEF